MVLTGNRHLLILAAALLLLWVPGWAASPSPSDLSDKAFDLLQKATNASAGNEVVGAVGGFAADAQALATATRANDSEQVQARLSALSSDAAAVDAALQAHPGTLDIGAWTDIKTELGQLQAQNPKAASSTPAPKIFAPSRAEIANPNAWNGRLRVVIESSVNDTNDARQVRGFMEGRDLSSAGVYHGADLVKELELTPSGGLQKVNFDLRFNGDSHGLVIRVFDRQGHSAQAPVDQAGSAPEAEAPEAAPPPAPSGDSAVAEVPTIGSRVVRPGRSIQIVIDRLNAIDALSRRFEVSGRIMGVGVHRAGIYVDGRLVKVIPVNGGGGYFVTNFTQDFNLSGRAASVRAYSATGRFSEVTLNPGPVVAPPDWSTLP